MSERARVGILIFLLFLGTAVMLGRLFWVSVVNHKEYIVLADEQQSIEQDILPKRGTVYVRDLASNRTPVVAQSVERFALSLTPRNVDNPAEYARLLAELAKIDEAKLRETLEKKDANGKRSAYMDPIMHGLTKEDVDRVATAINNLEKELGNRKSDVKVNFDSAQGGIIYYLGGTYFVREYQRTYPEGPLMGQLLGFVNDRGLGQYGFEGQYDKELRGYIGRLKLERDARKNLLQKRDAVEGKDGTSYELSIDRNIQYYVEQELAKQMQESEAKSGSVIVMDPKTGEIVAMASNPSYDPNKFREVAAQSLDPFDNPVTSKIWEPGSIFKPLIMSAAMDQGLVTPQTKGVFPASVVVDGYTINTALNKAFGEETMTQVLENSDNVAMVWVGDKLGNKNMQEYLQRFGFGSVTGIDLKNEVAGKVIPLSQWRSVNRATMSFGQGISVTPIQVVTAYSAIANDGKKLRPRVVHALVKADGTREVLQPIEEQQVIKPEVAKQMRDMLVSVVVKEHKRAGVNGYKVGGKTGTAQIPDPEKGGYIADAFNHSFVGMAPSDDPKFVVLVKIDQPNLAKVGRFAEGTAVPLFGRIAEFLIHYYQIPPTNR